MERNRASQKPTDITNEDIIKVLTGSAQAIPLPSEEETQRAKQRLLDALAKEQTKKATSLPARAVGIIRKFHSRG